MPLGNNPDEYSGDLVNGIISKGGGAVLDPMTSAMISAGSNVLGKMLTPAGGGPSSARSNNWLNFDNSGWTVATGGSKADAVAGMSIPGWAWLVAGVVLLVWVKQKKS